MNDTVPTAAPSKGKPGDRTWTTTDSRGRVFTCKRLSVLDQARMYRAMGAEAASNAPYARLVLIVNIVTHINGVPRFAPSSEQEIEEAMEEIGDEGYQAIGDALDTRIVELRETDRAKRRSMPGAAVSPEDKRLAEAGN